jgi:hypothetical protein
LVATPNLETVVFVIVSLTPPIISDFHEERVLAAFRNRIFFV